MKNRSGIAGHGFRQARTRTLIQLGGLIEKSGLFEVLGLIPGSDLQKDPQMQPIALGLLGAFLELKNDLQKGQGSIDLWKLKAQEFLNESNKSQEILVGKMGGENLQLPKYLINYPKGSIYKET